MLATSQTEHGLGSTSLAYHSRFTTKSQKKQSPILNFVFAQEKYGKKTKKIPLTISVYRKM